MLRSVGSGTGPDTEAPVRVAVSTISRAARSRASWSYAFSRIRILLAAIEAKALFFCLSRRNGAPSAWGGAPVVSLQFLRPALHRPQKGPARPDRPPESRYSMISVTTPEPTV